MAGAWAATTDRSKVVTLYDALVRKGLEVNYAEGYDMKSNQLTGLQEHCRLLRLRMSLLWR